MPWVGLLVLSKLKAPVGIAFAIKTLPLAVVLVRLVPLVVIGEVTLMLFPNIETEPPAPPSDLDIIAV
ncbi:MAG: hypothetical protein B7W97_00955, partial [Mycobacterium sp. 20-66-4]